MYAEAAKERGVYAEAKLTAVRKIKWRLSCPLYL